MEVHKALNRHRLHGAERRIGSRDTEEVDRPYCSTSLRVCRPGESVAVRFMFRVFSQFIEQSIEKLLRSLSPSNNPSFRRSDLDVLIRAYNALDTLIVSSERSIVQFRTITEKSTTVLRSQCKSALAGLSDGFQRFIASVAERAVHDLSVNLFSTSEHWGERFGDVSTSTRKVANIDLSAEITPSVVPAPGSKLDYRIRFLTNYPDSSLFEKHTVLPNNGSSSGYPPTPNDLLLAEVRQRLIHALNFEYIDPSDRQRLATAIDNSASCIRNLEKSRNRIAKYILDNYDLHKLFPTQ